jgi:acetyl esterase/lipase
VNDGLHPQVRALVAAAGLAEEGPGPPDLEAERATYLQTALELGGPVEEVARVEEVVIPRADGSRVRARAYWPRVPADALGVLIWLHGGGWYVGDIEGFDRVTRQLANASGAVCLSVDYRLAPEHRYPAAVEDARAAVAWAVAAGAEQLGTDAARVLVGGDSAGGNLAAVAARHAPGDVRAQLLVYPALDAAMTGVSHREFAKGPMFSTADMARCWRTYLGDRVGDDDPDASPLAARDLRDLRDLPRAYIAVAGHDPLRDDGLRYAAALRAAGVAVVVDRYDDMVHGFLRWGGVVHRARELIEALGDFARVAIAR